jgi:hypothetical protein
MDLCSKWRRRSSSAIIGAMDESIELSSLLASLEEIATRVSALVERQADLEGVGQELVALERSLNGSVRRLQRAMRTAQRRP